MCVAYRGVGRGEGGEVIGEQARRHGRNFQGQKFYPGTVEEMNGNTGLKHQERANASGSRKQKQVQVTMGVSNPEKGVHVAVACLND